MAGEQQHAVGYDPEDELALLLVGTAHRRAQAAGRIRELARSVDPDRLIKVLERQRVLVLAGRRLVGLAGHAVPAGLQERIDQLAEMSRRHAVLVAHATSRQCRALAAGGVRALALKGAPLAERIYDDPGARSASSDIDLLVSPHDWAASVRMLEESGYRLVDDTEWVGSLPHYHAPFVHAGGLLPAIELHWRVHWYERDYADEVLRRALPDDSYVLRPAAVDDLAQLLLIYARDAFLGLRFAADIAAWWDRYGEDLPEACLDGIAERHPALRRALVAAAGVCDELIGIPRERLVSQPATGVVGTATRLANWPLGGDGESAQYAITLTDLLLTPRGARRGFVRHYMLQPVDKLAADYDWDPDQSGRNQVKRLAHAAARAAKSSRHYGRHLWTVRGGRRLAAVPEAETLAPR
jgi:hypothetical protein